MNDTAKKKSAIEDPNLRARMGWGGRFHVGPYSYDNAHPGLFGGGNILLTPTLNSPRQEISRERDQAVANSRKVERNNPLLKAGITKRAVNTVGADLQLQSMPDWEALGFDEETGPEFAEHVARQVEMHHRIWGDDPRLLCDASRRSKFGALMLTAARHAFGSEGETLIVVRHSKKRKREYNAKYGTFIEVIDTDRLSTPSDKQDGPLLEAGKVLDEYGAATGFWIETTHPRDSGKRNWKMVPRETSWGRPVAIHWFFQSRAGAQRQMPAIIASLRSVKMLDDFNDAQLQAAVVNAILSIFVESDLSSTEILKKLTEAPTGGKSGLAELMDLKFNYYRENAMMAGNVRVPVLPLGDKIHMSTANRAMGDTKDFRTSFTRAFAAELNLSHEQFSGDYSDVTFSSARQAIIDIWRLVTVDRHLFTNHVAHQVHLALMDELFTYGLIDLSDYPNAPDFWDNMTAYSACTFTGPGMGWVDPEKDVNAANKRTASAFSNYADEAANQGGDFYRNIDAIARQHVYAEQRGVWLPTMLAVRAADAAEKAAEQDPVDDGPPDEGREGRSRKREKQDA